MIINANSANIPLADKSIHCVITSPPYWQQRLYSGLTFTIFGGDENCDHDFVEHRYFVEKQEVVYGVCSKCRAWRGFLGLERNVKSYIIHLVKGIFHEVRRVLRDDGILIVNLGDKKNSTSGGYYATGGTFDRPSRGATKMRGFGRDESLPAKNTLGIPWRFAFAMQRDGWILRQEVIWKKETPMPSSLDGWKWMMHKIKRKKNEWEDCPGCEKCNENGGLVLRYGSWTPTLAHEYIFIFSKKGKYFCDAEAVRQPHAAKSFTIKAMPRKGNGVESAGEKFNAWLESSGNGRRLNPNGANPRSVMTFPVEPLNEEHFAAFPSSLPEFFIKVGTSGKGCCAKCGAPWARIMNISGGSIGKAWNDHKSDMTKGMRDEVNAKNEYYKTYRRNTIGWKPTCKCDAGEPVPCVILDPFFGSGRTAEAAIRLGRRWIGLELSPEYCAMAKRRLSGAIGRNGATEVKSNLPQTELFDLSKKLL